MFTALLDILLDLGKLRGTLLLGKLKGFLPLLGFIAQTLLGFGLLEFLRGHQCNASVGVYPSNTLGFHAHLPYLLDGFARLANALLLFEKLLLAH